MKGMLSPSLMCADLLNLESEIKTLDNLGVEYIHLDFMDGAFVPNITLDTNLIRLVKTVLKNMKRDIHIMAFEPQKYFDSMNIGDGDIVAVHYEACKDLHCVLSDIRKRNAKAFVALKPETDLSVLDEFIDEIDGILVMTVTPGFAGQPMAQGSLEKILAVRKYIDNSKKDIILEVDGHVSWEMAPKMRENGADLFVAGSSSVYGKGLNIEKAVKRMNSLIS